MTTFLDWLSENSKVFSFIKHMKCNKNITTFQFLKAFSNQLLTAFTFPDSLSQFTLFQEFSNWYSLPSFISPWLFKWFYFLNSIITELHYKLHHISFHHTFLATLSFQVSSFLLVWPATFPHFTSFPAQTRLNGQINYSHSRTPNYLVHHSSAVPAWQGLNSRWSPQFIFFFNCPNGWMILLKIPSSIWKAKTRNMISSLRFFSPAFFAHPWLVSSIPTLSI